MAAGRQVVSPQTEGERRAIARERVAKDARVGRRPRDVYSDEDLEWAFKGRPDELAEHEELASEIRAHQGKREKRGEQRRKLASTTETILAEWAEAERTELRRKAEVEARRRLGLEDK
jgi:hypothetical protein